MASNNVDYYEKLKQLQEKQHSRLVISVLIEQRNDSYYLLKAYIYHQRVRSLFAPKNFRSRVG